MPSNINKYDSMLQPRPLSPLPVQIPVVRIMPDRPPPDLGTFVFPASPLPLPVMPAPPTWSSSSPLSSSDGSTSSGPAVGGRSASLSPRNSGGGGGGEPLLDGNANVVDGTVVLDGGNGKPARFPSPAIPQQPKVEKDRRRVLKVDDRERDRDRDRRLAGAGAGPALIVPAPSYAFTMLIPSAALFDAIPDVLPLWGTQSNAPVFTSSSSSSSSMMMMMMGGGPPTSTSGGRMSKKDKKAAAEREREWRENEASSSMSMGASSSSGGAGAGVGDMWEGTIGYTDDSDVRLMVLHSGFVSLEDMRAARLGVATSTGTGASTGASTKGTGRASGKGKTSASSHAKSTPAPAPPVSTGTAATMDSVVQVEGERAPRLVSSGGRRDLAVRLLWRGVKSRFKSSWGPASGGSIQSGAWGTSHDGGVLEIERIQWLPVRISSSILSRIVTHSFWSLFWGNCSSQSGYAHSRHVPNRKARMAQYASERARLHLVPASNNSDQFIPGTKSANSGESPVSQTSALSDAPDGARASGGGSRRSLSTDATAVELDLEDGELEGGKLSVLLGFGAATGSKRPRRGGTSAAGGGEGGASFVYDPDLVRVAVFPPPPAVPVPAVVPPSRKRRKLDNTGASSPVEIPESSPKAMRTVLLYNDTTT